MNNEAGEGLLRRSMPHAAMSACGMLLGATLFAGAANAAPGPIAGHIDGVRRALADACGSDSPRDVVLAALGGGIVLGSRALPAPPQLEAVRHSMMLPDGTQVRLDLHRRHGRVQRLIVELRMRVAGSLRPRLWLVTDDSCTPRAARRMDHDERGVAVEILTLNPQLQPASPRLMLDAPLPEPVPVTGVPVAMVDSGVNYTLPAIARRLARRADGSLVGYDFWDMDARPFDSHPGRNAFFPQRHGTVTASILLDEAPPARVAPYRYPRPDMTRMQTLVRDVDAAGIRIVNLSLGGAKAREWDAFERSARAHPHILFIASAGNNGRDIDTQPVYPASLSLDNLVTVTSSDASGRPARGSNWGRRSVHLMLPAEEIIGMDFEGYARVVSGSSYAAARLSALAACLLAANPGWQAQELRAALFQRARSSELTRESVRVGLIEDPTAQRRGACDAVPDVPVTRAVVSLGAGELRSVAASTHGDRLAPLAIYLLQDSGWSLNDVMDAVRGAGELLAQCAVSFSEVTVHMVNTPAGLRYFSYGRAHELVAHLQPGTLSAWFVRDTLERNAFDAQAIGRSNGRRHPSLIGSAWLTSHLRSPGQALAHELYHVLADSGAHVPERDNLMFGRTANGATGLTDWQCERLKRIATAFHWLDPAVP